MSTHGNMPLDDDIRVIQRNIAKGFQSAQEVEKTLAKLPDSESMGEYWDPTEEPEGDEDADAETAEA